MPDDSDDASIGVELTGYGRSPGAFSFIVTFNKAQGSATHSTTRVDVRQREVDALFVHATEFFFPRSGDADVNRL